MRDCAGSRILDKEPIKILLAKQLPIENKIREHPKNSLTNNKRPKQDNPEYKERLLPKKRCNKLNRHNRQALQ